MSPTDAPPHHYYFEKHCILFCEKEEFEEALIYYHECLELRRKLLPEFHPKILDDLCAVSDCYMKLKMYTEALHVLDELDQGNTLAESSTEVNQLRDWASDMRNVSIDWFGQATKGSQENEEESGNCGSESRYDGCIGEACSWVTGDVW